jgi:hypothetical protein
LLALGFNFVVSIKINANATDDNFNVFGGATVISKGNGVYEFNGTYSPFFTSGAIVKVALDVTKPVSFNIDATSIVAASDENGDDMWTSQTRGIMVGFGSVNNSLSGINLTPDAPSISTFLQSTWWDPLYAYAYQATDFVNGRLVGDHMAFNSPLDFTDFNVSLSRDSNGDFVYTLSDSAHSYSKTYPAKNVGFKDKAFLSFAVRGNYNHPSKIIIRDISGEFVEGVSINENIGSLKINNTAQLTATINAFNSSSKTVRWESSDNNIATVSSNGLVTALDYGYARIRAILNDNSEIFDEKEISISDTRHWNVDLDYKVNSTNAGLEFVFPQRNNWGWSQATYNEMVDVNKLVIGFKISSLPSNSDLRFILANGTDSTKSGYKGMDILIAKKDDNSAYYFCEELTINNTFSKRVVNEIAVSGGLDNKEFILRIFKQGNKYYAGLNNSHFIEIPNMNEFISNGKAYLMIANANINSPGGSCIISNVNTTAMSTKDSKTYTIDNSRFYNPLADWKNSTISISAANDGVRFVSTDSWRQIENVNSYNLERFSVRFNALKYSKLQSIRFYFYDDASENKQRNYVTAYLDQSKDGQTFLKFASIKSTDAPKTVLIEDFAPEKENALRIYKQDEMWILSFNNKYFINITDEISALSNVEKVYLTVVAYDGNTINIKPIDFIINSINGKNLASGDTRNRQDKVTDFYYIYAYWYTDAVNSPHIYQLVEDGISFTSPKDLKYNWSASLYSMPMKADQLAIRFSIDQLDASQDFRIYLSQKSNINDSSCKYVGLMFNYGTDKKLHMTYIDSQNTATNVFLEVPGTIDMNKEQALWIFKQENQWYASLSGKLFMKLPLLGEYLDDDKVYLTFANMNPAVLQMTAKSTIHSINGKNLNLADLTDRTDADSVFYKKITSLDNWDRIIGFETALNGADAQFTSKKGWNQASYHELIDLKNFNITFNIQKSEDAELGMYIYLSDIQNLAPGSPVKYNGFRMDRTRLSDDKSVWRFYSFSEETALSPGTSTLIDEFTVLNNDITLKIVSSKGKYYAVLNNGEHVVEISFNDKLRADGKCYLTVANYSDKDVMSFIVKGVNEDKTVFDLSFTSLVTYFTQETPLDDTGVDTSGDYSSEPEQDSKNDNSVNLIFSIGALILVAFISVLIFFIIKKRRKV